MNMCACGSSVRLRFDREASAWVCVGMCPTGHTRAPARTAWKKRKQEPLFDPWFVDPVTHERTRATRDELRAAVRIWYQHRDIREGRADA